LDLKIHVRSEIRSYIFPYIKKYSMILKPKFLTT